MPPDGFKRTERARRLRKDSTPSERRLWSHLRGKRFHGFKFRRQQPIDRFIVDFYCSATRLVVELDGDSHVGREAEDALRKSCLENQGLTVLRFADAEIFENLGSVLEAICNHCMKSKQAATKANGTERQQLKARSQGG